MATMRISEKKYKRLSRQARAFRLFSTHVFESVLRDPVEDVVEDFRKTGKYTTGFLADLEEGLRKSSYARRHGAAAAAKRS